jgi:hypothetical protein
MTLPQWRQWWRRCSTLKPLEHVEHTCRSGWGSNIRSQAARAALYKPCRGHTARRAHLGALVRLPLRPPVRLRRDGALANCSGLAGKHIARDRPGTPKDALPASHTVANIAGLDLWHPCSTQNSIFCVDNRILLNLAVRGERCLCRAGGISGHPVQAQNRPTTVTAKIPAHRA